MSNDTTAALTADDWRLMLHAYQGNLEAIQEEHGTFAAMAFANHWLPDGDPRKITRADVALLRGIVDDRTTSPDRSCDCTECQDARRAATMRLVAIADLLAEFFPPE